MNKIEKKCPDCGMNNDQKAEECWVCGTPL